MAAQQHGIDSLQKHAHRAGGLAALVLLLVSSAPPAKAQEPSPKAWTADEVAAAALETAPSLERAKAARFVAEAAADQQHVGLWPRLELSGTYTRLTRVPQEPQTIGGFTIPAFPQFLNRYTLRASAVYPVSDAWLRIWPAYKAARQLERV